MRPYYDCDGITIYHGDCREVLPGFAPDRLVLADPPYGIDLNPRRGGGHEPFGSKGGFRRPSSHPKVVGDDQPFDPSPLLRFQSIILWGANHYADRLPAQSSWIVWDKREGTTSDDGADCELAWTNFGGVARLYSQLWRGMLRRGEENGMLRVHPTQKPVALMMWCLGLAPNVEVLDPYMGSGTTLVAAKRLNRRAIGIEIEERYCEIAARRLDQGVLNLSGGDPNP